ncbi:MAG: hypothetical protein WDN30_12985 [Pararobbsia sp.]
MNPEELKTLGDLVDGFAPPVRVCLACGEGEPELSNDDGVFELRCPECDHTSGPAASRVAAAQRNSPRASSSRSALRST